MNSVLHHYLIDGRPVGKIADELGLDRSVIRGHLRDEGIALRPSLSGYPLGRDPVCDAVKRAGFDSFHDFAQVRSLDPVTEQAEGLGVSEKALARVYNAYRKLLVSLKAAGVTLPTSQASEVDIEREEP